MFSELLKRDPEVAERPCLRHLQTRMRKAATAICMGQWLDTDQEQGLQDAGWEVTPRNTCFVHPILWLSTILCPPNPQSLVTTPEKGRVNPEMSIPLVHTSQWQLKNRISFCYRKKLVINFPTTCFGLKFATTYTHLYVDIGVKIFWNGQQ